MLDENFKDTDPVKLDDALQQIVTGLCQAADGFKALKDLLPTVPVADVAKIVQAARTPYLQPMSKAAIQALQTLEEEDLINHACLTEFQKGVSQAALMRRYDVVGTDSTKYFMARQDLEERNTRPSKEKTSKLRRSPEVSRDAF